MGCRRKTGTSFAGPGRFGKGHRPWPSAAPGSGSHPPGRALASPSFPDLPVYRVRSRAGGETRCVSSARPMGRSCALCDALSLWQGPSPLPQRCAGTRTSRGPKPPASARPAPGGRFSPAGSGAGLCVSQTCRSTQGRPTRAGKRDAFPVPARRREGTAPASLAGAIAPATVPRRDQDGSGAKTPGQRPPRPRRALPARRVGRLSL